MPGAMRRAAEKGGELMRFMKYIGEIWRCAALYRTAQYETLGIGCFQDQYLLKIYKNPGITQEEIAEALFVHKSNVARQVASLEEKGLIERRPDAADRRALRAYPTEKAAEVVGEILRIRGEWTQKLLDGMTEEQKSEASQLLCDFAERAKAAAKEYGESEK